jgi:hypothetical protein
MQNIYGKKMNDFGTGSLKPAGNAAIGDNVGFDRNSLKAYTCESRLKRVMSINRKEILEYVLGKFNIMNPIKIRIEDSKEKTGKVAYEDFDVIEVIKSKLTSMKSKDCIKLWDIYEDKGLLPTINAIQYLSPIQKI